MTQTEQFRQRYSQAKTWLETGNHADWVAVGSLIGGMVLWWLLLHGWTWAMVGDRSFHLYTAQEIARGDRPYVDFFNIHPPLGVALIAIPLRLFPGLTSGVGLSLTHSVWTLIWAACCVPALYLLGKHLTGQRLGGIVPNLLLFGTSTLMMLNIAPGQNRILVMSGIVVGVALMQRDRWFWAGVALGVAILTYYPAVMGVAGAWILIPLYKGKERWRRAGLLAGGMLVVLALVLVWLALSGGLVGWYNVTVKWPITYLTSGAAAEVVADDSRVTLSSTYILPLVFPFIRTAEHGTRWIFYAAWISFFVFIIKSALSRDRQFVFWNNPSTVLPLLMCALTVGYTHIEDGPLDVIPALPFLMLWPAWVIVEIVKLLGNLREWLRPVVSSLVVAALVFLSGRVVGGIYRLVENNEGRAFLKTTLDEQIEATNALFSQLPADTRILNMGDLWVLNLSHSRNSSPFYHSGNKMKLAAQISGMAEVSIFDEVISDNPDIVLLASNRANADFDELGDEFMASGYDCIGMVDRLVMYAHSGDGEMLKGAIAMQQVFPEDPRELPEDTSLLSLEDLDDMDLSNTTLVAPGLTLLDYDIAPDPSTPFEQIEMVFYVWYGPAPPIVYLAGTDINGKSFERRVPRSNTPPNSLVRTTIPLKHVRAGELSSLQLRLYEDGRINNNVCGRQPFVAEPITLFLRSGDVGVSDPAALQTAQQDTSNEDSTCVVELESSIKFVPTVDTLQIDTLAAYQGLLGQSVAPEGANYEIVPVEEIATLDMSGAVDFAPDIVLVDTNLDLEAQPPTLTMVWWKWSGVNKLADYFVAATNHTGEQIRWPILNSAAPSMTMIRTTLVLDRMRDVSKLARLEIADLQNVQGIVPCANGETVDVEPIVLFTSSQE